MTTKADAPDRAQINRSIRELATRSGVARETVDALIDRQATLDEAREAILDDMLKRQRPISSARDHNAGTMDNPDAFRNAVSDAIFARAYPTAKLENEAARQFVGMRLSEIARDVLRRDGLPLHGGPDAILTRALSTTSDFPALLENVTGKSLLQGYAQAPSSLKSVARQTTAADFRAKNLIKLDAAETLEEVPETGEFRHGRFLDSKESYRLKSYGKLFGVSRQALVNDDLAGLSSIPAKFGEMAAGFEAAQLVALLESNPSMLDDGVALFHATHGNLATAHLSAPDVTNLSEARQAMRVQTNKGGALITVVPKFIVIGADNETIVDQLMTDLYAAVIEDVNPFTGKLTPVVEPRLAAKAWYLASGNGDLEYAHLASAPGPQLSSKIGFEIDGMTFKVALDFGCGFTDFRGWFKNPGQ